MTFKSKKELKDFLIWAKKQKISRVTIQGESIEVEFSAMAFMPENEMASMSEAELKDEYEDILYWSGASKEKGVGTRG